MSIKSILEIPVVYDLWQIVAGDKRRHKIMINDYIGPTKGKSVLELGCGTADLLQYLEPSNYIGIDMDESYIAYSKKRYANRKEAAFHVMDLNEYAQVCKQKFDIILMIGVVHHISDNEVKECFARARELLSDGGVLIAADGVYVKAMSAFEHWLLDMDRGDYVRDLAAYKRLHEEFFDEVHCDVRKDLMNLPFYIVVFKDCMHSAV